MFWDGILVELPRLGLDLGEEEPKFLPREGQVRLILVPRNWWENPKFHHPGTAQGGLESPPPEVSEEGLDVAR